MARYFTLEEREVISQMRSQDASFQHLTAAVRPTFLVRPLLLLFVTASPNQLRSFN